MTAIGILIEASQGCALNTAFTLQQWIVEHRPKFKDYLDLIQIRISNDINAIEPKFTPFVLKKYLCEDVKDGVYTGTPFYFPESEITSGYNFIDLMSDGYSMEDITQNILQELPHFVFNP